MLKEQHSIIQLLREHRGKAVHVIDPYKVPVADAVEKARAVASLGSPILLVGSTDYTAFDDQMALYLAELQQASDLKLLLHFPPRKGHGAPISEFADGILGHCVLNSVDEYFVHQSLVETQHRLNNSQADRVPELLPVAAFTVGPDAKTFKAVGSQSITDSPTELSCYTRLIKEREFDIVYIYSRHGQVSLEVCEFFRANIYPEQILFVSGGVRSQEQVSRYLEAGADYVVFGTALETEDWKSTLTRFTNEALAVKSR